MKTTNIIENKVEIEYPASDGAPMGETDYHRDLLLILIDLLKIAFPHSYVSGNLFIYYEQDNPKKSLCPDVFLSINGRPGKKRIYKLWQETPIDLIIELTSDNSKSKDYGKNKDIYASILKVPYYIIFDPEKGKLDAYALKYGIYQKISPNDVGRYYLADLKIYAIKERIDFLRILNDSGQPCLTQEEKAEREAKRANKLADKLRELGIDPESL